MRLAIRGGRLVDPANGIDRDEDLYLAGGRVVAVGRPPEGFDADRSLDATGLVVCPGLIDLCARLREPGEEHKATVASEVGAAAASGITTLVCPPDTDPVIDEPAVAELIRRRAGAARRARVLTVGALTRGLAGEQLAEHAALREAGCIGVGTGAASLADPLVLRRCLEYAATFDLTVFLSPMDQRLAAGGLAHDGAMAASMGLAGIPVSAETAVLARDLELVAEVGVRAHVGRLSSARGCTLVARARDEGLPVSADTSAQQLHLCEEDLAAFDAQCHLLPPLRARSDREGLRGALAQGVLGALCSDHQPHEPDAKEAPFGDTQPGASGLETLLPLALGLVEEGVLALSQALERLTAGPARVLRLDLGQLAPGAVADLCLFDPGRRWRLRAGEMVSAGQHSPFDGRMLAGRVIYTLFGGEPVFEDASAGSRLAPMA